MESKDSPQLTSETPLGYDATNRIIPQTPEKVNTLEEKNMYSDRSRNNDRDILANVPADSKTQSCINCKVSSNKKTNGARLDTVYFKCRSIRSFP